MSDNFVSQNLILSPIVNDNTVDIKAEEKMWRSVFPEEVWLLIAHNAEFGAIQRLREISPYFWILFQNAWIRWFPQLAEILYNQLKDYQKDVQHVMKKCPLVCRHWQISVDAIFQNVPDPLHPLWYGWHNLFDISIKHPYFDIQFLEHGVWNRNDNITEFRQHFAETHEDTSRNPFLYRSVLISFGSPPGEDTNLTERFLEVLRAYGQHIWYCVIYLTANDNQILAYYRRFYEMLEFMPNLRSLFLRFDFRYTQPTTGNDFKLFVQTHPFPTLKHLKSQKIYWVPTSVFDALTRANPQIRDLDVFTSSEIDFASCKENLLQLEDFSTGISNEQQFRMLNNLSFAWPLRNVYLQIRHGIPCRNLFRLLRKNWSATLIELTLDFSPHLQLLDMPPLNLPNLQAFSLSTGYFTPLEFLLPTLYSLKTLSVRVKAGIVPELQERLENALEAEGVVKFLNFRNNLSESNIWSFFPKLRFADYKDYTRGVHSKPYECRRFDWMLKKSKRSCAFCGTIKLPLI